MKFSELWLREWVNIALDSEGLSNQITMAGLEVSCIQPVSAPFCGVVIGKIIECNQHPNASGLRVIKVDIGDEYPLDIICNAPNCRQGLKVAVATVGAVLPGNLKIKTIKLFGKLYSGMLCSYTELGNYNDHSADIIELPENAPIGIDIRNYLKLDDNTIEINVSPNRADCLGIIGIARDIAVLNKIELNMLEITPVIASINDVLPIRIEAIDACPRYLGRIIKGINMKSRTPLWMKEKLRRSGVRSIDPVIDVTNYVLLELGQPIHAFDKDYINGGIVVRMAKDGETIVLLDGKEIKLNTDTLVIADYKKVLAIGGISNGKYSVINNKTKTVLLECAFFNPLSINSYVHCYDLHTDASRRYERGVDPELQHKAMERATRLLIDICGGKAGPVIDITNKAKLPKRTTITLRRKKLDLLIGHHINDIQVSDILGRLGCGITKDQDRWKVVSPSWRFDIKIEEDLVEEIARIYGYNNIPNKPIQTSLRIIGDHHETKLSLKRVKMLLNDKGYQEVITYSFVDPKLQKMIHPNKEPLILPSPISKEMSAMRLSLWTGLLLTIIYNQNRQQSRMRIFETGLRFIPDFRASLGVRQEMALAGAICGNRYEEHWDLVRDDADFYDIKGDLESILDLTGKLPEITFRVETIPALHPGQSAGIYLKDKHIGFIGVIHPELERKLNLNGRTVLFELEWNKIADRIVPQAKEISRFPATRRDISVVVPENIPAADILNECRKINTDHIVNVNLFDIYRGKGVKKNFKSLSISLFLQNSERTLQEEEIAAAVTKCIETLKKQFRVLLRD